MKYDHKYQANTHAHDHAYTQATPQVHYKNCICNISTNFLFKFLFLSILNSRFLCILLSSAYQWLNFHQWLYSFRKSDLRTRRAGALAVHSTCVSLIQIVEHDRVICDVCMYVLWAPVKFTTDRLVYPTSTPLRADNSLPSQYTPVSNFLTSGTPPNSDHLQHTKPEQFAPSGVDYSLTFRTKQWQYWR